ncbi:helix-turn-helix domain-containing protein [Carnobacterium maltaromaticum]|uniref:helix-turn-helix domain-containing protein n=1 Tax=Carnobacterium maltaromaticum TaxID=2751 RepID=UPI00295EC51E|nr:helix-turn-helix domain-containing protein [Carnobacterium maltaromaticum]
MHSLLEKNYLVTLELIECFYKTSNNNTISYFSAALNIDPRTLNKILFDLDYDLKFGGLSNQLTLTVSERDIQVNFSSDFSLEIIYNFYMKKSICIDLCILIFNDKYTTMDSFSERHYISRTTLYRKIKPLKDQLNKFDLSLNLSSKELIIGEEKQIRYFFYILFWEVLSTTEYFSVDYAKSIKKVIHALTPYYDKHFIFYLNLETHLSIALTRIKNNYFIENEIEDFNFPLIDFTFEQFKILLSPTFEEVTELSKKIICNEIRLLHFFISTSNVYPISKTKKKVTVNIENGNTQDIDKWITHFTNFYQIILNSDEYFYLLINLNYFKIKFNFLSGGNSYLGVNHGSKILLGFYPNQYKKFEKFITFLELNGSGCQIKEYQKFQYFLLVRELVKKKSPPFKMVIISKISEVEREWIQNQIIKRTNIPVKFNKKISKDINLIVSDYLINENILSFENNVYLNWSSFPSETEWKQLISRIEKIYYESFF